MRQGRVYWITGLSGSGKTTMGTELYYSLREKQDNVLILDGDILKQFVGNGGYGSKDRLQRGQKYAELCKTLSDQGLCVIICTIAMYDSIRAWSREHIKGYIEVFLDVPMEVLKARNQKGLYSGYATGAVKDLAGMGTTEFPKHPDLVLKNDGSLPVSECVARIEAIEPQCQDDFARDRLYWNEYYLARRQQELKPSDYAVCVSRGGAGIHSENTKLLELGCGNGRDSLYFLAQGWDVTGVDASDEAIRHLREVTRNDARALFVCDDFVKCRVLFQKQYDIIYSRFTLHAILEEQETELLDNAREAIKKGGRLCLEARTVHDDLYGLGEHLGGTAYRYNGHFRRFICPETLCAKMENMGYRILSRQEGRGFAPAPGSDPVLLRLEATVE